MKDRTPPAPAVPPAPGVLPRTLAAVDVGSNSIKLLVARAGDGDDLDVLSREKTMVRLGHETLQTGRLSEEAMAAGVACLRRFAALARASGAERILCAATCAVREARNGGEFARRVKEAADLDLEVISGEEEARLVTRAVRSDFPASADPLLVIDIGGGSTEVILCSDGEIPLAESLELGAVRLTDRFAKGDPMDRLAAEALLSEVEARVKRVAKEVRSAGFSTAVGTSGTIAALADVAAALEGPPEPLAGHRALTRRSLRRVVKRLRKTPARERERLPGLDPGRADIVTAGALLLLSLMERLGVKELAVCDRSLREGLLLDALDRAAASGEREARPRSEADVRRTSVLRLARKAQVDEGHAEATRRLALLLFDRTHALHQLADREREWLEHAAVLHDAGMSISYAGHHKHSAYLIAHGDLKGFAPEEVDVIAQVARYHRKTRPREEHEDFARLDPWKKPVVEKLAALLRLADALDRTHRGIVADAQVSLGRKKLVLTLVTTGDAELEVWAAEKKSALFSRVFGRRVELRAAPPAATAEASPRSGA